MGSQLDEVMVSAALGDLIEADRHLPESTVVALRLADVLTSPRPTVAPDFYQELLDHFSADQVLELGSALSVASGWQRFIEAFGIRPDLPS